MSAVSPASRRSALLGSVAAGSVAASGVASDGVDASALLRLTSGQARVVVTLFAVSNVVYAVTTLDEVKHALPVLLAMLIVNAAAVLLVLDAPDPFPLSWTWAIVGTVASSTVLVAFQLPEAGPPGRASWHLGSNAWLLFFLALRRRPGFAWLGYSLMATATLSWTISVGRGAVDGVMLLDTHAAILFVATLFEVNLRRTARQINAFELRSVTSAIESAEGAASAQIRQQRVEELRASAVPLLEELITVGPPADLAGQRRFSTAEALLRDSVRGKSLVNPLVATSATQARSRGVEVTLLDDRGSALASAHAMSRLTQYVVAALADASEGAVTVRLAPANREVAVSIVTSTSAGVRSRIELDAEGNEVGHGGVGADEA